MGPRLVKNVTLSLNEKFEIVQMLMQGKKQHEIVAQKGVDKTVVWRIWKNREDITRKIQDGKGRFKKIKQPQMFELEAALVKWIQRMKIRQVTIHQVDCMAQANEFAKSLGFPNWNCSYGWFGRFKRRNCLTFEKNENDIGGFNTEKRDKKLDLENGASSNNRQIEFDEADLVLAEILEGREDTARKSFSTSDVAASGFEKFLEVNFKEDPDDFERTTGQQEGEEGDLSNDYRFPDGVFHIVSEEDNDEDDDMSGHGEEEDSTGGIGDQKMMTHAYPDADLKGYDEDEATTANISKRLPKQSKANFMPIEDRWTKLRDKKLRLEVDLLELERYKRKLEILKLERDLGLPYSKITSKIGHSAIPTATSSTAGPSHNLL